MNHRRHRSVALSLLLLGLAFTACIPTTGKPTVVIVSPPSGAQFREGEDIAVQSTATDPTNVVRVELVVDNVVVRVDPSPSPQGQPSVTLIQTWKATQGPHTLIVRAYNTTGAVSDPVAISLSIPPASSGPAPKANEPPPTGAAPAAAPPSVAPTSTACTNGAAFVSDVTVPDGMTMAAGQTFDKIWRVRNNGTCAWTTAFDFAFVSGEAMATTKVIAVPNTAPGATADLQVAMTAPTTPGTHSGQWRLRTPSDAYFGTSLTVSINVPGAPAPTSPPPPPPAVGCSGTPNIEYFNASSTSINAGNSTTLNWGAVTNADSVEIDNGIGGVASPGNTGVSPGSTTTYTMTARCGSNTRTAQVTINVTVLAPPVVALPDLYVSEFSLNPSPPHKSTATLVRVGVYNQGNAASAGFKVQWWAGSNYPSPACNWTVGPLPAHGGQILTCNAPANTWGSWYGSITTRVKVDYENSVTESNETNNVYDKVISVSP